MQDRLLANHAGTAHFLDPAEGISDAPIAIAQLHRLATAILDIGERMEYAKSLDALDELQDELEAILRGAVIGLRDGTISADGLETFKLGYEFVRDQIGMRRDHLNRHAGHDDDAVVVKTAQSA